MERKTKNRISIGLAIFSMCMAVYIGNSLLGGFRLDLTEEKIYSISEGTKSVLSKLNTPIRLKLYYSKTAANKGTEALRFFNKHYTYVKDLLHLYAKHSRNNLKIELIDPRPDTAEEEEAVIHGLRKFALSPTESYFFGLVAKTEGGQEKVIDFIDPNKKDSLEYDITKLIYQVQNPQKKQIGVLSSIDVLKDDMQPYLQQLMRMQGKQVEGSWISFKLLKEFHEVKKIEQDTEKISGLDLLVLIHPKDLSEKTAYAIDQYLMNGGKLLVFADPAFVSSETGAMGPSSSPGVQSRRLLRSWGVEIPENKFAGDKALSGYGRASMHSLPTKMLALLSCDRSCVTSWEHNVSTGLEKTNFILPGALEWEAKEGLSYKPIISTSKQGGVYQAQSFELSHPQSLWQKFRSENKEVPIGLQIVGKFKSAFDKALDKETEHLKESKKETAALVFSDLDFITDNYAFQSGMFGISATNDNSNLFLNAVESQLGNTDLMSIRAKGRVDRSFKVVSAIEEEAEKATKNKVMEIQANINRFQAELNELGSKATAGNVALLRNEGLKKKKELAKKLASLKKELREVKREGREKVESLGMFLRWLNALLMPFVFVLLAFVYQYFRQKKKSKWQSSIRESEEVDWEQIKGVRA